MEKDLFGESSVEEDSSDDELPREKERGGSGAPSSSSSSSSSEQEGESESMKEDKQEEESKQQETEDLSSKDVNEGEGFPVLTDSQFPNTQDLFGTQSSSDSSSSGSDKEQEVDKDETSPTSPLPPATDNNQSSQMVEGIFGETADISSSDDEGKESHEPIQQLEPPPVEEEMEEEVPRIEVEIPRCVAQLGSEQYFVKLPNFLSIETRPFDSALYEDEIEDEGDLLDEDGRARLKLKVENTLRWRKTRDDTGQEIRESNSRIVQWSDGSMSLYLGGEIFDIYKQPLQGEFSHLFVRQGTGLQGQAVFKNKITFRPHSTDSQTHRKMTLSIADRFSKAQKIRVLPVVEKDPESRRNEMIKQEEQRLRASVRLESQQRRMKEKRAHKGLSASFLEPRRGRYEEDDEEDEEEVSISAIKSSVRSRVRKDNLEEDEESDEEEEEEEEEDSKKTKERNRRKRPSREASIKTKGRKLLLSDDDDEEDEDDSEF